MLKILTNRINCGFLINSLCKYNVNTRKRFRLLPALNFKKFKDNENDFAYGILEKMVPLTLFNKNGILFHQIDEIDVLLKTKDWEQKLPTELVQNFEHVAKYCAKTGTCISDDRFDKLIDMLVEKCHQFNDEQLVNLLKHLSIIPPTPSLNTKNFVELWSALDTVCTSRVGKWNIDQLLYVADHWYAVNLSKIGKYTWNAVKKLSNKVKKMNKQHLVQTMFYLNLCRQSIERMMDVEMNLQANFNEFSIEELSILCMAFFKTETPIRHFELVTAIYLKTIDNLNNIEDIGLVSILKLLRYSSRIPHAQMMTRLLDEISPEIPRLSLLTCLHIVLLGSDIHYCHEKSCKIIIERFIKDIKQARLKDMERICFAMGLFNIQLENGAEKELCRLILHEVKHRVDEITIHPKCFPACLHFLSIHGFYSEQMISSVLEKNFLSLAYGKNYTSVGREVLCLDSFAKINLKDTYKGTLLPRQIHKTIARYAVHYVPQRNQKYKLTNSDKLILEVQESYEDNYGKCHVTHALPHFQRPDIICLYDKKEKKPLDLKEKCPPDYSGEILTREFLLKEQANDKNLKLFALVIGGWNCYVRDLDRETGLFMMKTKQLEMIGYDIVRIPWYEWSKLQDEERSPYLKDKVDHILNL